MRVETTTVTKLKISSIDALDPIGVILEDFEPRKGQITICCYGKAWTAYWGGMGGHTIAEFFTSCDEHYIANKLSNIDSQVFNIEAIRSDAKEKDIECWRDDPWNDYEFMEKMYGHDMVDWHDSLPKTINPDYKYLCLIITTVQNALKSITQENKTEEL